jgi:hypothetical protein
MKELNHYNWLSDKNIAKELENKHSLLIDEIDILPYYEQDNEALFNHCFLKFPYCCPSDMYHFFDYDTPAEFEQKINQVRIVTKEEIISGDYDICSIAEFYDLFNDDLTDEEVEEIVLKRLDSFNK